MENTNGNWSRRVGKRSPTYNVFILPTYKFTLGQAQFLKVPMAACPTDDQSAVLGGELKVQRLKRGREKVNYAYKLSAYCHMSSLYYITSLILQCHQSLAPSSQKQFGRTPVYIASAGGHGNIVNMLIQANSDINHPNKV